MINYLNVTSVEQYKYLRLSNKLYAAIYIFKLSSIAYNSSQTMLRVLLANYLTKGRLEAFSKHMLAFNFLELPSLECIDCYYQTVFTSKISESITHKIYVCIYAIFLVLQIIHISRSSVWPHKKGMIQLLRSQIVII